MGCINAPRADDDMIRGESPVKEAGLRVSINGSRGRPYQAQPHAGVYLTATHLKL